MRDKSMASTPAASTNQRKGHPCGGFFVDGGGADENPSSGFDERCERASRGRRRHAATGRSVSGGRAMRNKRMASTPAASTKSAFFKDPSRPERTLAYQSLTRPVLSWCLSPVDPVSTPFRHKLRAALPCGSPLAALSATDNPCCRFPGSLRPREPLWPSRIVAASPPPTEPVPRSVWHLCQMRHLSLCRVALVPPPGGRAPAWPVGGGARAACV